MHSDSIENLSHIDPLLKSDSRYSSASNTPLSPETPIWDKHAFAYVIQKQKNDRYKKRKRFLQFMTVFTSVGTLAATVSNFFSDNCNFNGYAASSAALTMLSLTGSMYVDYLMGANTAMSTILKPRDLPREDTQGSLSTVPEDM